MLMPSQILKAGKSVNSSFLAILVIKRIFTRMTRACALKRFGAQAGSGRIKADKSFFGLNQKLVFG
jgi:hypothetical protein